jgi:hypothetical protein
MERYVGNFSNALVGDVFIINIFFPPINEMAAIIQHNITVSENKATCFG